MTRSVIGAGSLIQEHNFEKLIWKILKDSWFSVCPEYYPSGGISDCITSFDTLEECKAQPILWLNIDSAYVFDRFEGEIVFDYEDVTPKQLPE